LSSSPLVHLSTAHAAALKGDLDSGNKLTHLDTFVNEGNIVSSAMLQALSRQTLLDVMHSAHMSMLCLPDMAVHQTADLIAQSQSCYHHVGALFPLQLLIPWTVSPCNWHHDMLYVRWQVLFALLGQSVRHDFNEPFQKVSSVFLVHHQLTTHQPLHHQAPQPLETRTTNLSRCLPCCRLFALA